MITNDRKDEINKSLQEPWEYYFLTDEEIDILRARDRLMGLAAIEASRPLSLYLNKDFDITLEWIEEDTTRYIRRADPWVAADAERTKDNLKYEYDYDEYLTCMEALRDTMDAKIEDEKVVLNKLYETGELSEDQCKPVLGHLKSLLDWIPLDFHTWKKWFTKVYDFADGYYYIEIFASTHLDLLHAQLGAVEKEGKNE